MNEVNNLYALFSVRTVLQTLNKDMYVSTYFHSNPAHNPAYAFMGLEIISQVGHMVPSLVQSTCFSGWEEGVGGNGGYPQCPLFLSTRESFFGVQSSVCLKSRSEG